MGDVIKFPEYEKLFEPEQAKIAVEIIEFKSVLESSGAESPDVMVITRTICDFLAANKGIISKEDYATMLGVAAELLRIWEAE